MTSFRNENRSFQVTCGSQQPYQEVPSCGAVQQGQEDDDGDDHHPNYENLSWQRRSEEVEQLIMLHQENVKLQSMLETFTNVLNKSSRSTIAPMPSNLLDGASDPRGAATQGGFTPSHLYHQPHRCLGHSSIMEKPTIASVVNASPLYQGKDLQKAIECSSNSIGQFLRTATTTTSTSCSMSTTPPRTSLNHSSSGNSSTCSSSSGPVYTLHQAGR